MLIILQLLTKSEQSISLKKVLMVVLQITVLGIVIKIGNHYNLTFGLDYFLLIIF